MNSTIMSACIVGGQFFRPHSSCCHPVGNSANGSNTLIPSTSSRSGRIQQSFLVVIGRWFGCNVNHDSHGRHTQLHKCYKLLNLLLPAGSFHASHTQKFQRRLHIPQPNNIHVHRKLIYSPYFKSLAEIECKKPLLSEAIHC